ncbi:hypothetical protein tloyanaT_12920 [Thalassotalea loyana]|uniref:TMhelix containing protein n=1 Tax=Thalassotalea loyana TaxID=280483 RepID=A0ABQ6HC76_9GAMM|nr:hypothetical protein [Thalassotalea loyana]GLX85040.1 hypothetical protein tloyanaT_12920 [Thalassotalea loyana]
MKKLSFMSDATDILKNIASGLVVGVISVIGTVSALDVKMVALKEDITDIKTNQSKMSQETKAEAKLVQERLRQLELFHAKELTVGDYQRYINHNN